MTRPSTLRYLGAAAAVSGLLLASTSVASVASAQGETQGTCATTGEFAVDGTCTVLAGETLDFIIEGGAGGDGGAGGAGGDGGSGWTGVTTVAGGLGGSGGLGGVGGAGARIEGTFTNDTASPLTLTLTVGVPGLAGPFGIPGAAGIDALQNPNVPDDGLDGGFGFVGQPGTDGLASSVTIDGENFLIAGAGTGGQSGTGGIGGSGGSGSGTPGTDGEDGFNGDDGSSGEETSFVSMMVTSSAFATPTGIPIIAFSGEAPEPTTTTPTTTPTTEAPVSTTTPTTTAPRPAGGQLPATGLGAGLPLVLGLGGVASGSAMLLAARRRNAEEA